MSKIRIKTFWEGCCRRKCKRAACRRNQIKLQVPKDTVMRAAYRIHEAGGCDTTDRYSEGYDDAIALALRIIIEETGFRMCEILEYGDGCVSHGRKKIKD